MEQTDHLPEAMAPTPYKTTVPAPWAQLAASWVAVLALDLPLSFWLLLALLPVAVVWTLVLLAQAFVSDLGLWLR